MKNNYLKTAIAISLKLLIICAVIAGVVSFVYSVTIDAYNQNLENEKKLADIRVTADAAFIEPVLVAPFVAAPILLVLFINLMLPAPPMPTPTGSWLPQSS